MATEDMTVEQIRRKVTAIIREQRSKYRGRMFVISDELEYEVGNAATYNSLIVVINELILTHAFDNTYLKSDLEQLRTEANKYHHGV